MTLENELVSFDLDARTVTLRFAREGLVRDFVRKYTEALAATVDSVGGAEKPWECGSCISAGINTCEHTPEDGMDQKPGLDEPGAALGATAGTPEDTRRPEGGERGSVATSAERDVDRSHLRASASDPPPRFKVGDRVVSEAHHVGSGTVDEVYMGSNGEWHVSIVRDGVAGYSADNWRGHANREASFKPEHRTSDAGTTCAYCGESEGHTKRCSVTRHGADEQRTNEATPAAKFSPEAKPDAASCPHDRIMSDGACLHCGEQRFKHGAPSEWLEQRTGQAGVHQRLPFSREDWIEAMTGTGQTAPTCAECGAAPAVPRYCGPCGEKADKALDARTDYPRIDEADFRAAWVALSVVNYDTVKKMFAGLLGGHVARSETASPVLGGALANAHDVGWREAVEACILATETEMGQWAPGGDCRNAVRHAVERLHAMLTGGSAT